MTVELFNDETRQHNGTISEQSWPQSLWLWCSSRWSSTAKTLSFHPARRLNKQRWRGSGLFHKIDSSRNCGICTSTAKLWSTPMVTMLCNLVLTIVIFQTFMLNSVILHITAAVQKTFARSFLPYCTEVSSAQTWKSRDQWRIEMSENQLII